MRKTSKIQIDIPPRTKIAGTCHDLCNYGVSRIDGADCHKLGPARRARHTHTELIECYPGEYYFVCEAVADRIYRYTHDPRRKKQKEWLEPRDTRTWAERNEAFLARRAETADERRLFEMMMKMTVRTPITYATPHILVPEKSPPPMSECPKIEVRPDGSVFVDTKNLELLKKMGFDVKTLEEAIKKARPE